MTIVSHPTLYKGILFRSRLEARWAAMFDLVGWKWDYEPFDLPGWVPDFKVEFLCGHSECPPTHKLPVEVRPYTSIEQFEGHQSSKYADCYGDHVDLKESSVDAVAYFGNDFRTTYWHMCHGAGAGQEEFVRWAPRLGKKVNHLEAWREAGNLTQWRGKNQALSDVSINGHKR